MTARSFDRPPVSSELLAGLDASPCYAWGYAPRPEGLTAPREVVGLVGMELVGTFSWSTARLVDSPSPCPTPWRRSTSKPASESSSSPPSKGGFFGKPPSVLSLAHSP